MMPRAITGESQSLENLGADRMPPPLGASDGNSDELHCVVGFNPHKNGVLAVLMGVTDSFAHILCASNLSPADFKDDVAALEHVLGGKPIRVDLSHDHAFGAAAGNLPSGGE